MNKNFELEVIAFDIDSCKIAEQCGASRIELCANPAEGGTTPSWGMIKTARATTTLPLFPIIRPRGGDFLYNDLEFNIMKEDIEQCFQLGCDGVVIGLLNADGSVDEARTAALVQSAGRMDVTFHRAFDRVADPVDSLKKIIATGCKRILTSGLYQQSVDGIYNLRNLVQWAQEDITIMVGSGVHSGNIVQLAKETGAKAFHSSARIKKSSSMSFNSPTMNEDLSSITIDPGEVIKLRNALENHFQ